MSSQTQSLGTVGRAHSGGSEQATRAGFLSRLVDRFVDARMRAARATVARELALYSDDHLKTLGLTEAQVQVLRSTGRVSFDK
ncbi:MAG: hypothetical protein ACFCUN_09240 [Hyphomicrobiaceae bacterium]